MSNLSNHSGPFVLLSEHNEYDQHGDYFHACFPSLPSFAELKRVINEDLKERLPDDEIGRLHNTGVSLTDDMFHGGMSRFRLRGIIAGTGYNF